MLFQKCLPQDIGTEACLPEKLVNQLWVSEGKRVFLHRPGIEPGPPAWQASILPLNQRCLSRDKVLPAAMVGCLQAPSNTLGEHELRTWDDITVLEMLLLSCCTQERALSLTRRRWLSLLSKSKSREGGERKKCFPPRRGIEPRSPA